MSLSIIHIYTDGGSRGNPGQAAIGVVITDDTGTPLASFGKRLGIATNNVAEYTAVIEALDWVYNHLNNYPLTIRVFVDSRLVCSQLDGSFKVKHPNMQRLVAMIREKEKQLNAKITYKHIPREQNKKADRLVNLALDNKI